MNICATKQPNELVFDQNGGKTCVIDMNHNWKPEVAYGGSLTAHLKRRRKTKGRFDMLVQDKCFKLQIKLFGGLRGSNGGVF